MEIRLAAAKDIPGILALLQQVGQVHHDIRPDIFRPDCQKYDESALLEILRDPQRPIFVAVEGDFVAGYCFCILRDYRGSATSTDRLEIYIDDLCVDESCRGQNVAKALYDHTCGYAKNLGCAFVSLNVWCGNHRAQRFYEKMGMKARSITMEVSLEDSQC